MAISSKCDLKNRFIEIIFDADPDILEYQKTFPEIARQLEQENISNLLIVIDFLERTNDKKSFEFSKFVFADLNRSISHLAILCAEKFRAPMEEVMEPIISQGKPVRFFTSRDDAVEWLATQ